MGTVNAEQPAGVLHSWVPAKHPSGTPQARCPPARLVSACSKHQQITFLWQLGSLSAKRAPKGLPFQFEKLQPHLHVHSSCSCPPQHPDLAPSPALRGEPEKHQEAMAAPVLARGRKARSRIHPTCWGMGPFLPAQCAQSEPRALAPVLRGLDAAGRAHGQRGNESGLRVSWQ